MFSSFPEKLENIFFQKKVFYEKSFLPRKILQFQTVGWDSRTYDKYETKTLSFKVLKIKEICSIYDSR